MRNLNDFPAFIATATHNGLSAIDVASLIAMHAIMTSERHIWSTEEIPSVAYNMADRWMEERLKRMA